MSFTIETYEEGVYGRLAESINEYMDEDMVDKLVPAIKKALCAELKSRREAAARIESIMCALFPGESFETVD